MRIMSVAKITEITAASPNSFDDAVKVGIARAAKTLKNVKGAWIQDQEVRVDGDAISEYRVHLKVTFVLSD
jgi:flavin-binding protein dodecin